MQKTLVTQVMLTTHNKLLKIEHAYYCYYYQLVVISKPSESVSNDEFSKSIIAQLGPVQFKTWTLWL